MPPGEEVKLILGDNSPRFFRILYTLASRGAGGLCLTIFSVKCVQKTRLRDKESISLWSKGQVFLPEKTFKTQVPYIQGCSQ